MTHHTTTSPHLAPTSPQPAGATSLGDLAPRPPTLRVGARSRGDLDTPQITDTTSPQGRGHKHVTGPRSIPAWHAALDYLDDGRWHPIPDLIKAMLNGSDLRHRTVQNYLASAGRRGWIRRSRGQVKLRDRHALEAALAEVGS